MNAVDPVVTTAVELDAAWRDAGRSSGAPAIDIEAAVRPSWWNRNGPRLALLSPLVILLLWEVASQTGLLDRRFFPPPSQVVGQLTDPRTQARLPGDIVASLSRILIGFGIGSGLGLAIGLWLGLFRVPRTLLAPIFAALYPIPKLALFPLLLVLFGLGDQSKWAAIAIGAFFLVFYNTLAGVLQIPPIYLDVARNAGASRLQVFRTVALPAAAPDIFTGLKLATGTSFVVLAAVEFVGGRVGLGTFLWSSWQTLQVDRMYLALVIFAILGFAAISFVSWVESRLVPWARR
jgi:NitT/TauT family transport system permease protein